MAQRGKNKRGTSGEPAANVRRVPEPPNKFRWPKRLIRLLGKVPDRVLAERAGLHFGTVQHERRRRGIPPYRPQRPDIEWTDEMVALLGTDTDPNVAAELGIPKSSVRYKRTKLGIPPYTEPSSNRTSDAEAFWTQRRRALLGTAHDGEIARRLGVTRPFVLYWRSKFLIPPFEPRPAVVRWTPEMLRWLGRVPDPEVAERFGIGVNAVILERKRRGIAPWKDDWRIVRDRSIVPVLRLSTEEASRRLGIGRETVHQLRKHFGVPPPSRKRPWPPQVMARLGREPDEVIARELGVKVSTVARKRQQLGRLQRPTRRWTAAEEALLGTASDAEIARRIGRTVRAVEHRRHALHIPLQISGIRYWTAAEETLLGTAPDAEIARRIGRSVGAVRWRRRALGIPAVRPRRSG